MAAAPLRVLISGGGIAGPAVAFWLSQQGHSCTIIERFGELRAKGQQIDLREQGIDAVRRMGLVDEIRKCIVDEHGVQFIDGEGHPKALFGKSAPGKRQSLSSEFEIMRGDLCHILHDATRDTTTYRFGLSVDDYEDEDGQVTVTLSDGSVETYDMLIAADGFGSRIRKKMLARHNLPDSTRSLGAFSCHYPLKRKPEDKNMALVCHTPGERVSITRWQSETTGQAYLLTMSHVEELRKAMKQDINTQKELFAKIFKDAGYLAPRLVEEMMTAEDFYATEIAQLTGKCWSKGNVVLVGDSGYCPSPFTGMGTSLALVGAYILAGEIAKHPGDIPAAFAAYDKTLRPLVDETQRLPPGFPGFLYPKTTWGVKMLHWALGATTALRIDKAIVTFTTAMSERKEKWSLPEYAGLQCASRSTSVS